MDLRGQRCDILTQQVGFREEVGLARRSFEGSEGPRLAPWMEMEMEMIRDRSRFGWIDEQRVGATDVVSTSEQGGRPG